MAFYLGTSALRSFSRCAQFHVCHIDFQNLLFFGLSWCFSKHVSLNLIRSRLGAHSLALLAPCDSWLDSLQSLTLKNVIGCWWRSLLGFSPGARGLSSRSGWAVSIWLFGSLYTSGFVDLIILDYFFSGESLECFIQIFKCLPFLPFVQSCFSKLGFTSFRLFMFL